MEDAKVNDTKAAVFEFNKTAATFVTHYSIDWGVDEIVRACRAKGASPRNPVIVQALNGYAKAWLCPWENGRETLAVVAL